MIVAINKIDRPEAAAEKIKKQLMGEGIIVESVGGKTLPLTFRPNRAKA
jgi:hypothetical protein